MGCHDSLQCRRRTELEQDDLELIWVEVKSRKRDRCLLGIFYRPPNSGSQPLADLGDCLTNASREYSNICVMGDFNLPTLHWNIATSTPNPRMPIDEIFVDTVLSAHNLRQLNFSATRGEHILDLALCTAGMKATCQVGDHIFSSDHSSLSITIMIPLSLRQIKTNRMNFNYRKADINDLQRTLECIPWCLLEATSNCHEAASLFHDFIEATISDVVPRVRPRRPTPPWFDGELRQALKAKEKAFKIKRRHSTPENLQAFKTARSFFKKLARSKYREYLETLGADLGRNPKRFWSFIKTRSRTHTLPPVLENEVNGTQADNAASKATLLMDHFQSTYPVPEDSQLLPDIQPAGLDCMPHVHIDNEITERELTKIDPSKAFGPDNLPGSVLKLCASIICKPLSYLFQRSLKEGIFPDCWKVANVVPIHKSSSKKNVANYRPVSLLPLASKVFERILCTQLVDHVQPAISDQQHGFVPGRDCTTNLTTLLQEAYSAVDQGGQLDVIYTDFSKAFDRVNHNLLIHKLASYYVHPQLLQLLRSFLTDRKHRVVVENECSSWCPVPAGVPQGSLLGPLLFTLYINDLPSSLKNRSLLFADDMKVFRKVLSDSDCVSVQGDLTRLHAWCTKWKLNLNLQKCSVMSVSLKKKPIMFNYTISECVLNRVSTQRDLGIFLDNRLSFVPHIDFIVKKANRMMGLVWRNFRSCKNEHVLRTLYCSLIRPQLEYCTVVFNSVSHSQVERLERLQRRYLLFMYKVLHNDHRNRSYSELCDLFKLSTLTQRRTVTDCLFLYRLIHSQYNVPNPFSLHVPERRTRSASKHILHVPRCRVEVTKQGFVSRISNTYNRLHEKCDVFGAPTLNSFRKQVYRCNSHS